MKRIKSRWVLYLIALLLLTPYVIWHLKESRSETIVVIDKTVPTDDMREHRALSWVLDYLKFDDFKGKNDYYGYFPETKTTKALPSNIEGTDYIYVADTYGVYNKKGKLVYGGLTKNEWQTIKNQVLENPSTLIMEYNTIASPTSKEVKEEAADLLGVHPTGWAGRAFQDLDKENPELTKQVIALYESGGEEWSFKGKGFVLIHEQMEKVVVLSEENGDINQADLRLQFTKTGTTVTGLEQAVPYTYWFDISVPANQANVWADYEWDLSAEGKKRLKEANIPLKFPAVVTRELEESRVFYFAGDFADTNKASAIYQYAGYAKMRGWVTPVSIYPEEAFLWKTYIPLMKKILSMSPPKSKPSKSAQYEKKSGLSHTARINGNRFDVFENGKWKPLTVKGVNIGMGTAGAFPGEAAITEEQYGEWLEKIGRMNANAIRVYTLHPPEFYRALKLYNETHKNNPIYVFHGIWIDEEPLEKTLDAYTPEITLAFQEEMKRITDVVHGNANLPSRKGHASGVYRADVSPYVLGWIIGIEWYPYMVDHMNKKYQDKEQYSGRFVETKKAGAMEIWLAEQMDVLMKYEADTYQWTRPMSFTNWVTTDILTHPAEPQEQEDLASVNPNVIHPKQNSDLFASYHVYPYYPDFLNLDKKYVNYKDSTGQNNSYAGYLNELYKAHDLPILIAEFGIPASRGMTHRNVHGLNQGFMSEQQQGEAVVRLYDQILAEKMMGGLVFSWQDEWFKRTWNTMELDQPERRPFWSNAQTNEQQFGLLSFDRLTVKTDGRVDDWKNIKPMYEDQKTAKSLSVTHDERYLYIQAAAPEGKLPSIYLDVHKEIGSQRINKYTFKQDNPDFLIEFNGKQSGRVFVDAYYDSFLYQYGIQLNMMEPRPDKPVNNSGVFHPIRYALNKKLVRPDTGQVLPFDYYETGRLKHGNSNPKDPDYDSLADYYVNEADEIVEIRIPWLLINIKDPSSLTATGDLYKDGVEAEQKIEGIGVAAAYADGETLPASDNGAIPQLKKYQWQEWNEPEYKERLKQSYYLLKERFSRRDP